jgi:hypothetical protein
MHRSFKERPHDGEACPRQWATKRRTDGRELAEVSVPATGWGRPHHVAPLDQEA